MQQYNANQIAMSNLAEVKHLTAAKWQETIGKAEQLVMKRVKVPQRASFAQTDSRYPPRLVALVIGLMVVVALAAFYISAGKEIAATDTLFEDLVQHYPRLSAAYVEVGIVMALMLSELGALLFGLGSRILTARRGLSATLRAFQLVCVVLAIVGNTTITMAHPVVEALVYDWFLTLAPPALVIGIGLLIEELLASWLSNRQEAISAYRQAVEHYQSVIADPQAHQDFHRVWGQCILEALLAIRHTQELLGDLLESNPRFGALIVRREWEHHQSDLDPRQTNGVSSVLPALPTHAKQNKTSETQVVLPVLPQNSDVSPNDNETKQNAKRPSPALDRALAWFAANPDRLNDNHRALALETGMSATSLYNAQKQLRELTSNEQGAIHDEMAG